MLTLTFLGGVVVGIAIILVWIAWALSRRY